MRKVGAILLAAGASTRLGRPKQLVKIGLKNLLERSVRVAKEAGCSPILVVLGSSAELILSHSNIECAQAVINQSWQEGIASSIRAGIQALPDVDGVVMMTCDMPAMTSSHLRALIDLGQVTATSHRGGRGVPAYLPRSLFSELMRLQGDKGAKDLLQHAPSIELPGGELDIDTVEDLRLAEQRFG